MKKTCWPADLAMRKLPEAKQLRKYLACSRNAKMMK